MTMRKDEDRAAREDDLVLLTRARSTVESEMLQELLRQEGIPVLMRENEDVGSYLKIYMGFSMFGESLYVRRADYARASQLLASLRESDLQTVEEQALCDDAEQYDLEQDAQWQETQPPMSASRKRQLWVAVVALLIILFALVSKVI